MLIALPTLRFIGVGGGSDRRGTNQFYFHFCFSFHSFSKLLFIRLVDVAQLLIMSRQFSALLVNLPLLLLLLCDRVVASVRSKTSFKAENGCFSCCHFALFSVLGLMDLAVSAATGLRTWLLNAKLLLLLLLTKLLGALSLRECSQFSLSLSFPLSIASFHWQMYSGK